MSISMSIDGMDVSTLKQITADDNYDDENIEPRNSKRVKMTVQSPATQSIVRQSLFIVPKPPQLQQIQAPQQAKKVPVPGYDMRTLRKQIDFLQEEVSQYTDYQGKLYQQNGQLVDYIRSLLEANKNNSSVLREQMKALHDEMKSLHEKRADLAEKLTLARSSKDLIKKLQQDLGPLHLKKEKAAKLEADAQHALIMAREENHKINTDLQEELDRLKNIHYELDDHRSREYEEEAETIAIDYWYTSPTVLKGVFNRFKKGIGRLIRLEFIHGIFERTRYLQIKGSCLLLWKNYINRRRYMHAATRRRGNEVLSLCMKRWKLYSVLQRHFHTSRRKHLLKRILGLWKKSTEVSKWESWALQAKKAFQQKKVIKSVFYGWKNQCMFIGWTSRTVLEKEDKAEYYFIHKLFKAWRRISVTLKDERQQGPIQSIPYIYCRKHFVAWRLLCRRIWKRRGSLIRRFFRNCRAFISERIARNAVLSHAKKLWIGLKKRGTIRKWSAAVREKSRNGLGRDTLRYFNTYRHKIILHHSLLKIAHCGALSRRQRACMKVANQHHMFGLALWGLETWRTHVSWIISKRQRDENMLISTVFHAWVLFVPMEKKERKIKDSVEYMFESTKDKQVHSFLRRWRNVARKRRRLYKCSDYLQWKCEKKIKSKYWSRLRCFWSKALYWREKEVTIEHDHLVALNDLQDKEINELQQEKDRLDSTLNDLSETIIHLQNTIAEGDARYQEQLALLAKTKDNKLAMEANLGDAIKELKKATDERHRLQAVEQILKSMTERDEAERKAREKEAAIYIKNLKTENASLYEELAQAKEQAHIIQRVVDSDISKQEHLLMESLQTSSTIEDLMHQRQKIVNTMEKENLAISYELEDVQRRIDELANSGIDVISEEQSDFRKKAAEVGSLRSNTNLAEARVVELRKVVLEQRAELINIRKKQILSNEKIELQELEDAISTIEENKDQSRLFSANSHVNLSNDATIFSINRESIPDNNNVDVDSESENDGNDGNDEDDDNYKIQQYDNSSEESNQLTTLADSAVDDANKRYSAARDSIRSIAERLKKAAED